AVDAHAELLVLVELLRRLDVLAFPQRFLVLANDVRLDAHELAHEIAHVDDQITDDRKVAKGLDAYRAGRVVREERCAGQLRLAVDRHPAAAADPPSARTAVPQGTVNPILDVVQAIEDDPVLRARYLVLVERLLRLLLRQVARYLHFDVLPHVPRPPRKPARAAARE